MQMTTITAGNSIGAVNITVINDNIIEENETFIMSFTIPSSLGPRIKAGAITSAAATIIDTSTESHYYMFFAFVQLSQELLLRFTQSHFTGVEATGFVMVHLELSNGWSVYPFSVTVTASEKSPTSAEGNNVIILFVTKDYLTNRWC